MLLRFLTDRESSGPAAAFSWPTGLEAAAAAPVLVCTVRHGADRLVLYTKLAVLIALQFHLSHVCVPEVSKIPCVS